MGLYKKGRNWYMAYTANGHQYNHSTHTKNKRMAQKILDARLGEITEGRFGLPKSNPPNFEVYAEQFLESIPHSNTKRRYSSSIDNLKVQFEGVKLSQIDAAGIEEFKQKRLASTVRSATVNRDLAVLRRMLRLAMRRRFITRTPFEEVEFLEERKARRRPHILTFGEELRLLTVAPPLLKALIVLLAETGLRVGKEALPLKWKNVDLDEGAIFVCQSKTLAGQRMVPLTERCKAELLTWQEMVGPGFSEYVFFNPRNPATHLLKLPKTWATALKKAAIEYFPIANLRHTFATRMHEARTSSLTLAGLLGHSSPGIVQTYAKVLDESRRDAIRKLEEYRQSKMADVANSLISNPRVN